MILQVDYTRNRSCYFVSLFLLLYIAAELCEETANYCCKGTPESNQVCGQRGMASVECSVGVPSNVHRIWIKIEYL